MFSHASTIKEIKLATFLRDTFVIAPLNGELCYEKGANITHFAIEQAFQQSTHKSVSPLFRVSQSTNEISVCLKKDILVHVIFQVPARNCIKYMAYTDRATFC